MRLYILYLFEGNFTLPRRSWRSVGMIYDRTRERLHRGNANRVRRNGRHFLNVSLFPSSSFSLTLSLSLFSFPVSLVRFHGLLIANLPNNRDAITRFFFFFLFLSLSDWREIEGNRIRNRTGKRFRQGFLRYSI